MKKLLVLMLLVCLSLLAGCGSHEIPSSPTPSSETRRSLLFMGDSIMVGLSPAIESQLNDKTIKYIHAGKVSSGLCNQNFYNWPLNLRQLMQREKPSLVLICLGTNDAQGIKTSNAFLAFKSKEWVQTYKNRVREINEIVKSHNAKMVWLLPPVMGRKKLAANVFYIKGLIQEVCDEEKTTCIDLWNVLANKQGKFQYRMTDSPSKSVEIRAKDGIHVKKAGNQKLASYVIAQLRGRFLF